MALEDPKPPVSGASSDWAETEARRRENAEEMDEIDSVGEMMSKRALPSPSESGGEEAEK